MTINELYVAIGGGIGTVLGGFSGWFFRRRYENASAEEKEADAKGKEIDNEIKLSDYYKIMLDDLGTRYDKKFSDIISVYEQKANLQQDEINLLKSKNRMLGQENAALRKRVKELEE
ncbi:hypothetical protein [Flavobacterium cerinum]|uniref:Cell wall anchor protein n=1 Tax=Flavobacterium cerinum TaxID=2502784 RepID=A0A3S3TV27_9FLAO|nr:hypothetical protein [Flavobacterium cerinum]RWW91868.1 hypothetical protein EPI11_17655 [Flavobacterium cerinum]